MRLVQRSPLNLQMTLHMNQHVFEEGGPGLPRRRDARPPESARSERPMENNMGNMENMKWRT